MNIQYFEESNEELTPPEMREPFRVGCERAAFRRKREFVETVERVAPVIEGPRFDIVIMGKETLERMSTFHYYG